MGKLINKFIRIDSDILLNILNKFLNINKSKNLMEEIIKKFNIREKINIENDTITNNFNIIIRFSYIDYKELLIFISYALYPESENGYYLLYNINNEESINCYDNVINLHNDIVNLLFGLEITDNNIEFNLVIYYDIATHVDSSCISDIYCKKHTENIPFDYIYNLN